ncbi:odorant receptor 67d-like [Rhagoletis pomonella]|uniref:odorant receptor 67d-like n=1 Tax=Rhagoletis pomonella TaxID=28610 RepID=UPI00177B5E12|nr:odorant receptor 67d-like [Rhagoletis pomonella]
MQDLPRPSDNYFKMLTVIRFCSRLIGIDVLNPDYKFNPVTAFVFIAIAWNFLCSINMIYKNFSTDWTVLLDVFSPISCATQGVVKLSSLIFYPKLYRQLAQELGKIYEKYQTMDEKYEKKLQECNKNMKRILIILGLIYFVSAWIALVIPLVLYILKGERHLIIMCQMPYIDATTNQGYFITIIYNILCVFIAAFGLYSADLYIFLFLTHSIFFYDIFELKVSDLRELLQQNAKDKRITPTLNDIAEWHQYYLEFNDNCNFIFFWTITSHMICTTMGILSTLLIIMLRYWPSGYAYIFVCFVWLYMYSILGTRVEICNDQFCDGIYDVQWYDLEVADQKTVLLMLTQAQVPRIITIAGIEPLSVNTALKITRTIYSISMMVLQFNE